MVAIIGNIGSVYGKIELPPELLNAAKTEWFNENNRRDEETTNLSSLPSEEKPAAASLPSVIVSSKSKRATLRTDIWLGNLGGGSGMGLPMIC
jgi:hypothetical protein